MPSLNLGDLARLANDRDAANDALDELVAAYFWRLADPADLDEMDTAELDELDTAELDEALPGNAQSD